MPSCWRAVTFWHLLAVQASVALFSCKTERMDGLTDRSIQCNAQRRLQWGGPHKHNCTTSLRAWLCAQVKNCWSLIIRCRYLASLTEALSYCILKRYSHCPFIRRNCWCNRSAKPIAPTVICCLPLVSSWLHIRGEVMQKSVQRTRSEYFGLRFVHIGCVALQCRTQRIRCERTFTYC